MWTWIEYSIYTLCVLEKGKIIWPRKKEGKGEKQEGETVKLTVTYIIGEE